MTLPFEYVGDGDWSAVQRNFEIISAKLGIYAEVTDFEGTGSPNTVVTASPGATYRNRSGGAGTTLYVKESGTNTNTGWVGK